MMTAVAPGPHPPPPSMNMNGRNSMSPPDINDEKMVSMSQSMDSINNIGVNGNGDPSDVRTLFVSGLPMDAKSRELYLLFRSFQGYLSSTLKPAGKNGKLTAPVGFVTFDTREQAENAMNTLQGVKFDPDGVQQMRLEFARSNTKVTKPKLPSAQAGIPSPGTAGLPPNLFHHLAQFETPLLTQEPQWPAPIGYDGTLLAAGLINSTGFSQFIPPGAHFRHVLPAGSAPALPSAGALPTSVSSALPALQMVHQTPPIITSTAATSQSSPVTQANTSGLMSVTATNAGMHHHQTATHAHPAAAFTHPLHAAQAPHGASPYPLALAGYNALLKEFADQQAAALNF